MDTVENMVTFQVGHLGDDGVLVALGYATSQEKLSKHEIEWLTIGMTRDRALQLAEALRRAAIEPVKKLPES